MSARIKYPTVVIDLAQYAYEHLGFSRAQCVALKRVASRIVASPKWSKDAHCCAPGEGCNWQAGGK